MPLIYHLLLYLSLVALLLAGLALTLMTLPGLWLMVASAAGYAVLTRFQFIGWKTLAVLLVWAGIAEVVELTSSGAGAKKAGGGRAGLWGALIGGIIGGIWLSIIPIPILSTLVGVCLGTFLGAAIGELAAGRQVGRSAWIGLGAAKGRLVGTFIKFGFGVAMFLATLAIGFPVGGRKPAKAHAIVIPTTAPAATQTIRR
jgi:uncharacterized protein YqgC (DUF456 family)